MVPAARSERRGVTETTLDFVGEGQRFNDPLAGGVSGLSGADDVGVSPDGDNVYVASFRDNAVAVFARDPMTASLTFLQEERDGVNGVDGLAGVGRCE